MRIRAPLLPTWVRWAAVIALAGFIFYVSIITVPPETVVDQVKPGPPDLIPLDKWRHFVAYAAFGYALAYAVTDWNIRKSKLAAFAIGVTVMYGIGIEFGQSLIPERYFSMDDAYANAFGGFLVIPWYFVRPYIELVPTMTFVKSMLSKIQLKLNSYF